MEITFQRADEVAIVRITGKSLLFSSAVTNFQQFVPIECLKLSISGVLKEFPDLKGRPDREIRIEAISRLKEHVKKLKDEKAIMKYVIDELEKFGWNAILLKKEGFRPINLRK